MHERPNVHSGTANFGSNVRTQNGIKAKPRELQPPGVSYVPLCLYLTSKAGQAALGVVTLMPTNTQPHNAVNTNFVETVVAGVSGIPSEQG